MQRALQKVCRCHSPLDTFKNVFSWYGKSLSSPCLLVCVNLSILLNSWSSNGERFSWGEKKKKNYKEKEKLITLCEKEKGSHSPALLGRTFGNSFGRRITVVQLYTYSQFYTKTSPLQKYFHEECLVFKNLHTFHVNLDCICIFF